VPVARLSLLIEVRPHIRATLAAGGASAAGDRIQQAISFVEFR